MYTHLPQKKIHSFTTKKVIARLDDFFVHDLHFSHHNAKPHPIMNLHTLVWLCVLCYMTLITPEPTRFFNLRSTAHLPRSIGGMGPALCR